MEIDDEAIREFCEIWKKEFGEVLSESEARLQGSRLLELYSLLAHVEPAQPSTNSSPDETPSNTSI